MRIFLFLLTIGVLSPLTKSYACSCAPIDSFVKESYEGASVVVLGIPESTSHTSGGDFQGKQKASIKVISSLKGDVKNIVVQTVTSSAACGMTFQPNSGLYLIFAYKDADGVLTTSLCSSAVVSPQNEYVTKALKKLADIVK